MGFTAHIQSTTTIAKEIKRLTFSTVTGGASETIVFPAGSLIDPVLSQEAITTANAHSAVGQQTGMTLMLDFGVLGLGETADWTALNELKSQSNVIAYVKIEFRDGPSDVWDSGTTGEAIIYLNEGLTNGGDTLVVPIHCERIVANLDRTIS